MQKLDLEKAKEPETKLPTSTVSEKARKFKKKKKIHICFIDYAKTLTVWITTKYRKFLKR